MKEYNIHKMIDLYFDAQLSRIEEEELFERLRLFKGNDQKVDEALAVMLMARGPILDVPRHAARTKSRFWGVAAAIALIAGIGITALWRTSLHDSVAAMDDMVAYVGGMRVDDHAEIMEIVDNQLNDIGICSDFFTQEVSSDLNDIREALNSEDI